MSKHAALDTFGRSGNPVIRSSAFNKRSSSAEVMTLDGAVNKTGIMLALVVFTASISWVFNGNPIIAILQPIGYIAALISMIMTFGFPFISGPRPHLAPKTSIIYSIGMGFIIGSLSLSFESLFPGIVIQAVSLTFFVAASLLFFYKSGLIRPDENFRLILFSATFAILIYYIFIFIISMITGSVPEIFAGNSMSSILIQFLIVGIAALNLVLDFDIIEKAAEDRAPKYMEDFGAMALVVTLVWLYVEILRLIAKLRSNN